MSTNLNARTTVHRGAHMCPSWRSIGSR